MKQQKKIPKRNSKPVAADFFGRIFEESWTHVGTVVDATEEPALILDKNLRVIAANKSFYWMFQVEPKETEGKFVYKLGDSQWNSRPLRKLLENIIFKKTFFKGHEVTLDFPLIGRKVMILNAREIQCEESVAQKMSLPPGRRILLAMQDISEMMLVAEMFANRNAEMESKAVERAKQSKALISVLESENNDLKKKLAKK